MTIKFATKNNSNGWRYQLEIDTIKHEFKYGSHLFHYADVNNMTKKQLDEIVKHLIENDFKKIN